MRAFPDPEKPKAFYLDRVRRHRMADELIRGTGWDPGMHRGCAVGCTLEAYNHALYPELLGVPEPIAYLQDWLFEHLPDDHQAWPERFLEAIPTGADLLGVYPAWVVRLMARNLDRLGPGDEPWLVAVRTSIVGVRDLFQSGTPDELAWSAAWSAARSAAEAAARSAAWSAEAAARSLREAAARSAEAAARSARSAEAAARSAEAAARSARSAEAAAWSAEAARSAWSAESAEILHQAEDLIELLRLAPVAPWLAETP